MESLRSPHSWALVNKMNRIRQKAIDQFQGAYLAIISVVQGTALGFLVNKVFAEQSLTSQSLEIWVLFSLTLFVIIILWHEYFMGTTAMPFVPGLFDSMYPFLLGVTEFMLISTIDPKEISSWFLIMAILFIAAFFGLLNMYTKAKKEDQNKEVFKKLGRLTVMTQWSTIPGALIFLYLFFFMAKSHFFISASIAFIILNAYGLRSYFYWKILVSEEQ
jgi:hypothetical protein